MYLEHFEKIITVYLNAVISSPDFIYPSGKVNTSGRPMFAKSSPQLYWAISNFLMRNEPNFRFRWFKNSFPSSLVKSTFYIFVLVFHFCGPPESLATVTQILPRTQNQKIPFAIRFQININYNNSLVIDGWFRILKLLYQNPLKFVFEWEKWKVHYVNFLTQVA